MFKYIVFLTALFIAGCSAWFSITGISQLFVGQFYAAAIMAGSLELGKLVAASFVYRWWYKIGRIMKYYMVTAIVIISAITSVGTYAFLSAAYADTAVQYRTQMMGVSGVSGQVSSLERLIDNQQSRLDQLNSIRDQQESRLEGLIMTSERTVTGDTIATTERSVDMTAFNAQQEAIQNTDQQIQEVQSEISELTSRRDSLELEVATQRSDVEQDTNVGTFVYVAETIGMELDDLVNWFILTIVVVFDPFAVSLLIAYNVIVVTQRREKEEVLSQGNTNPPTDEPDDDEEDTQPESPVEEDEEWLPPPDPQTVTERLKQHSQDADTPESDGDIPYFRQPDYDWENDDRWKSDARARLYYSRIVGNKGKKGS